MRRAIRTRGLLRLYLALQGPDTTQGAASMSSPSWGALLRHGRAADILLLTLGVGVHAIDVFILATILPSVVTDIGGAAFYTWSTMLYVVASILGTAGGGFIRARYDLRHSYTG